MAENLLNQSSVKLYGRELNDVKVDETTLAAAASPPLGDNNFLYKQVIKGAAAKDPRLARIYAFTFEGSFYNLPRPAIFLVHGKGGSVSFGAPLTHGPSKMDETGLVARDFFWEQDVTFWEYDKDDVLLRLDPVSGTLEDILIEASLSSTSRSGMVSRSGMAARSGAAADADETMRHRLR